MSTSVIFVETLDIETGVTCTYKPGDKDLITKVFCSRPLHLIPLCKGDSVLLMFLLSPVS